MGFGFLGKRSDKEDAAKKLQKCFDNFSDQIKGLSFGAGKKIDEIKKRPNTSLDITWMSEEENHDDRSLGEILKEMNEKSKAISDAIAELNKALEGIDDED